MDVKRLTQPVVFMPAVHRSTVAVVGRRFSIGLIRSEMICISSLGLKIRFLTSETVYVKCLVFYNRRTKCFESGGVIHFLLGKMIGAGVKWAELQF